MQKLLIVLINSLLFIGTTTAQELTLEMGRSSLAITAISGEATFYDFQFDKRNKHRYG
jgi:hypothetical protein